METDEAFFGKGAKLKTSLPLDQKASFIGKKAYYLYKVRDESLEKLQEHNQTTLYEKVDFPLIKVLKGMEDHGVLIDRTELDEQTAIARKKVQAIEGQIKTMLGDLVPDDFNVASPKQIKELLYDKLQLPNLAKGSTSREALEQLKDSSDVVPLILEYRK
jgi:DNA polymerase-1